jgi:hypothetical protein
MLGRQSVTPRRVSSAKATRHQGESNSALDLDLALAVPALPCRSLSLSGPVNDGVIHQTSMYNFDVTEGWFQCRHMYAVVSSPVHTARSICEPTGILTIAGKLPWHCVCIERQPGIEHATIRQPITLLYVRCLVRVAQRPFGRFIALAICPVAAH